MYKDGNQTLHRIGSSRVLNTPAGQPFTPPHAVALISAAKE